MVDCGDGLGCGCGVTAGCMLGDAKRGRIPGANIAAAA